AGALITSRHTICGLDQTRQCQLRHVSHIGVSEAPVPAQREHGGNPLQVRVALLDRHRASRSHDDLQLVIGQTKHLL
ncbi:MAG: hypothetical protein WBZ27_21100, partial [Pseudolabrys sp.]